MLPIEVVIIGGIISILTLLERLIRYIPKLNRHIDRLRRSKTQLESVRDSISIKDTNEIDIDDIREINDLIENLIDIGEELNFIKP
jgi:hypothetical protein